MQLLGQLEHSVYVDDCEGLSVDEIDHGYGVGGVPAKHQSGQSGAGHSSDEEAGEDKDEDIEVDSDSFLNLDLEEEAEGEDDDLEGLDVGMGDDEVFMNIEDSDSEGEGEDEEATAIFDELADISELQEANKHHKPVEVPDRASPFDDEESYNAFLITLQCQKAQHEIPRGYGLLAEEWGDSRYPSHESIHVGTKAREELHIALPDHIWHPRAELWGQALHLMNDIHYFTAKWIISH